MTRLRSCLATLLGAATLAVMATVPLAAHAQTKIKMVLNWKYQGPQAWFFMAQDRGYFKAEGLDVEIDQGEGSSASITKVASGAYQAGSATSTRSSTWRPRARPRRRWRCT